MYIDESGTPSFNDSPKYFLLTGVIVDESNVKQIKKIVFDFKQENFSGTFNEAEIHLHEMFRSKNEFISLKVDDKRVLIDKLYRMIKNLPITAVISAINKPLLKKKHPKWSVFKTAFIILLSRYNTFLESIGNYPDQGMIRMDKSTDKQRSEVNDIVRMLCREKKNNQIKNIIGTPYFVNSDSSEGIQIADAISFCVGKKLLGNPRFPIVYWDMIKDKVHSKDGKIEGYGLNVFPHMQELESEDIRP